MNKTALRKEMIQKRNALARDETRELSERITHKATGAIPWSTIQTLHVYSAAENTHEVPTDWVGGFVAWHWPQVTVTYGQAAPSATLPIGTYDAVIVPLVAFDNDCNRLGFGGGWYDRFLVTQPQALKIGLAYELQRVEHIAAEPHDVRLDMVITEQSILRF